MPISRYVARGAFAQAFTEDKIMRDNIKYMLSNWLKWDRKSLVYFLIRMPALVFQPIVTSYIPKAMIDCINEGARQTYACHGAFERARCADYLAFAVYAGTLKRQRAYYSYALCGACFQ